MSNFFNKLNGNSQSIARDKKGGYSFLGSCISKEEGLIERGNSRFD